MWSVLDTLATRQNQPGPKRQRLDEESGESSLVLACNVRKHVIRCQAPVLWSVLDTLATRQEQQGPKRQRLDEESGESVCWSVMWHDGIANNEISCNAVPLSFLI